MTAEEVMTVEAETKEETEIEIAQIIEVETVETIVTGNVRSAITRTSHSEPNAIAVENLKEEVAGTIEEAETEMTVEAGHFGLGLFYCPCLLYTSPSPRDAHETRMPSSA